MRLVLLTFLTVLWAGYGLADTPTRQITVIGEGEIAARPDMAQVVIGVEVTARTAGQALDENSKRVRTLFAALREAGIAERDIQTRQLNLHPRWEQRNGSNGTPTIIGYTAQNTLQLRIRRIDTLGAVLDQVTKSGANRIEQISFTLGDPAPLLRAARLRAVADARAKAELLSEAAGVTLGEVLVITESSTAPRPYARATARMEAASSVPVAEGEVSLSASVTIVYALN